METIQAATYYDCKPWQTGALMNNTNLLNNLKKNLHYYEQGFRKFTIKSKCELPQINTKPKTGGLASENKISDYERLAINKSTEIPKGKKLRHKQSNCTLGRQVRDEDKQNKQVCTQRHRYKEDFKTKIFLINFQEQNKYKRMKKREIHQVVFGDKNHNLPKLQRS